MTEAQKYVAALRKIGEWIEPKVWAHNPLATSAANFIEAQAKRIEELEAEIEKWKKAFAAQSQKLQAVLPVTGVKEALAVLNQKDQAE